MTFHTSWKELAKPKLILTTPNSLPTRVSRFLRVTPGESFCMSSSTPRMAAAPPGLHTHPVRREILFLEAAYSIKELGIISPEGYIFVRHQLLRPWRIRVQDRLTEIKMKDTTDPASDCSLVDLSRRVGMRERIRTIGVPVVSCRKVDIEEMRKCVRHESRKGRNGI
jgi:hypothetical protein